MEVPKSPSQDALSILRKYYSTVTSLRGYLDELLHGSTGGSTGISYALMNETDSETYVELLETSLVGLKDRKPTTCRVHPPMLDMREILDKAQSRIFKSKRHQNIITSGYRLASHDGDRARSGLARIGITNYFLNTIVTVFQSPEWEMLLQRIGEDAMLHLLADTSIFLALPNGCLCQITGEPLIHMVPNRHDVGFAPNGTLQADGESTNALNRKRPWPVGDDGQEHGREKRRKLNVDSGSSSNGIPQNAIRAKVSPADISFQRVRLFYSRPNYVPHTNRIIVGLSLKHILNRLQSSYEPRPKSKDAMAVDECPRQQAENARHLSKYVFARQYGLTTPFTSPQMRGSPFQFGDYLDRETEIKAMGYCKTPKRLKETLPLLEKLLRRHGRCGYVPLRDRIKSTGSKDLDSSVLLEMISETSVQLRSQVSLGGLNTSLDSNGNSIKPLGLTQARKHAKQKPRFVEFSCSHVEVYRYVALVTNAVIPKTFWGSKQNLKLVLGYVKELIRCRRYETLSLHYFLQTLAHLLVTGSSLQAKACNNREECYSNHCSVVYCVADSFSLKTTFYVTESSALRNQVLYFRHDDWDTLCAPLIERLSSVTFEKLSDAEAEEILRQRRLGFSFVRLLPKETGVRPIVNLRRRKTVQHGSFTSEQSINQILQAAFNILTYEKTNQPGRLGVSIFSPDDIYLKLKKLKASLPRGSNGALPRLYFVKVDVQTCFDTIDQSKLLSILREIVSEDVYMTQKFGQVSTSLGRVKRTYVKKAVPEDDHPHFIRFATDLANVLRNTIFVDQVVYPLSKKQEVLDLLEEHITENLIGQSYYRQKVGIPQGSVLSSILCSFFYGNLEKKFSRFMDPHSILLRLIDDYLYVTTSLEKARGFLDVMNKGHPEYGCFISQDKTLTNFSYGDLLNVIDPSHHAFPWCGYTIDTRNLSIRVDYMRYRGSGIRSTLTIDRGRRPGIAFSYKMLQLAKAKSHAIFSDSDLNTEHVVYLNLYQNLLMTAVKMHEYIRDWSTNRRRNNTFLETMRRGAPSGEKGPEIHKEMATWWVFPVVSNLVSLKNGCPVEGSTPTRSNRWEVQIFAGRKAGPTPSPPNAIHDHTSVNKIYQQCHLVVSVHKYQQPPEPSDLKSLLLATASPGLRYTSTSTPNMSESGFYSLKAELPGGKTYDFATLKGKTVLIVNTASKCGFTPQYKGLQALYDKYKDQGLEILGFPCNQFGGQEPADDKGIEEFCTLNHGVTFPLMKKSEVNGDSTNEVYQWLKSQKAGLLGLTRIKWNFEKFLVDKNGNVVHRWASTTTPQAIDSEIAKII
ncbi:hypothetical protein NLJ89_g1720 [Agrocybe chaxingu]|uniref:Telomerase reverse transcriptase n=1 Tax=Agrocybe chaxingu TaxID=84603 RepID=A0A9W8MZI2_9AGAR|nr:hypothetical protein NLJ89_g1720 [Agrocybe chaxingu]